jgi:hypothetical protein
VNRGLCGIASFAPEPKCVTPLHLSADDNSVGASDIISSSDDRREGPRAGMEQPTLPKLDYHLDKSDPDILLLRRPNGSFVAAFSVRGVTEEGICETAKEDYLALREEYTRSDGRAAAGRLAAPPNLREFLSYGVR